MEPEGGGQSGLGLLHIMRTIITIMALCCLAPGQALAASPSPTPAVSPSPTTTPVSAPAVGEIWLNEVLPNPVGTDTGQEWVELYNRGSRTVMIGGMVVARVSGTTLLTVAAGVTLAPGAFKIFYASGSIVNGGDTLVLKSGTIVHDQITYDATGLEGQTWARLSETVGGWTDTPTPEAANAVATADDPADTDTATAAVASGASTSASTAKRATTAKKASASKLPKSGIGLFAYLIPLLAWSGYRYGRRFIRHYAHHYRH